MIVNEFIVENRTLMSHPKKKETNQIYKFFFFFVLVIIIKFSKTVNSIYEFNLNQVIIFTRVQNGLLLDAPGNDFVGPKQTAVYYLGSYRARDVGPCPQRTFGVSAGQCDIIRNLSRTYHIEGVRDSSIYQPDKGTRIKNRYPVFAPKSVVTTIVRGHPD